MKRLPFIIALLSASTAWAETPPPSPRAPAIAAIFACRQTADPGQRLACYDTAAAQIQAAEAQGDLLTLDRAQRRAVRRQAFGLTLPSLSLFDRGESAHEVDTLSLTVKQASRGVDGRWLMTLEGDQLWRQTDSADLSRDPKPGMSAEIHKAAFGSFMMSVDRQPPFRVHRDR